MNALKSLFGITTVFALTACDVETSKSGTSTAMPEAQAEGAALFEAIQSAETVSELTALGAKRLTGSEMQAAFVGKTINSGSSWDWKISANGTSVSAAKNGSWQFDQPWEIKNNEFCRTTLPERPPMTCSVVYELAGVYRFTDEDDQEGQKLIGSWTVQ